MPWRHGELGLVFILLVACESEPVHPGGTPSGAAGAGSGGTGGTGTTIVDMGSGPEGPWSCTASVEIFPPAVPVRGTVTGDAVNGTLCAGGIAALAQDFANPDTGEVTTLLSFSGPSGTTPRFELDTPSGVDAANLEGRIGIGNGDPQPGTFTNDDSCGDFTFGGGSTNGDVLFLYSATAASNCDSTSIFKSGSWSLTVDALTPVPEDTAGTAYIAHGHLDLTVEQVSPRSTAVFDLEF